MNTDLLLIESVLFWSQIFLLLVLFKRKSSLCTNDVLAHRFTSFLGITRANGSINSPVQFESFVEVVRPFDGFASPFVKNRGYHLD